MTHTDQQRGSSHKIYYHKKGPDHNMSRIVTQVTIINQQGGGVYHQTFNVCTMNFLILRIGFKNDNFIYRPKQSSKTSTHFHRSH